MALVPATVLTPGLTDPPVSLARATARALLVGGAVVVVALAVVLLAAKVGGWQTLTVLTGSMRPAIAPGQAIVVSPMTAREIAPGQVITFRRPNATGTVTHRVEGVRRLDDGRLSVTTRGDANPASETWQIPPDGQVGRLRATLPAVGGTIGSFVAGPRRPYLLATTVLLGTTLVLFWIWRPEPRREAPSGAGDGGTTP